jgi:lipopolysaccharide biosynthesis glycosyltransferase
MSRIPNYLRVSPQGVIYIDIDKWKHSPVREHAIEQTEQSRRYLKNESDNR